MASGVIAGAALAGALGWIPFVHHQPGTGAHDKHLRAAPGSIGGARYVNQSGAILIPTKVKDRRPWLMMLDTGATHSALDAKMAYQAGISFWGENASPPATAKETSPRRLEAVAFKIGDAQLFSPEPHAIYKPFRLAGRARGRLGDDVLGGYIMRIDPRYRMVNIYDPLRFSRPINSVALPLTVTDQGISVPVTLHMKDGGVVVRQARLDTGLPWTMSDDAVTVANLASVDLGSWNVPQTAGHGPGVGAPSVGMGLLQGFIVTLDVPDRLLFLQDAGKFKPRFQYTARVKADGTPARPKKRFIVF